MEYKNVTKTIIGVATGKPIRLILNFGKRKELRDFRNSLIRDNSCLRLRLNEKFSRGNPADRPNRTTR